MKRQKEEKKQLETDAQISYDFAEKCYKKFRDVIKAIAMFGSAMKNSSTSKSDIDIIIIIDDCTVNWDEELIAWYREELAKLLASQTYPKELHINTVTLTAFWEELRAGEPLVINILRYGEPLIDVGGFFDPLKVLLAKGKIRPTPEAIFTTMERSGSHLGRANAHILNSVEGFYWAMVDSAHSALMALHVVPPSPEHLGELMEEHLVKRRYLNRDYIEWYEDVRKKAKEVLYGDVTRVSGKEIEELQRKSEQFVQTLTKLTREFIKNEKIIRTEMKQV
ncbi:MAG TPA: nucleotidyltransferase domain-containing protein [Candidatus Nanoarchaeia archaeon]|nr:nucleotidyltransferase domain-containing protein [Candidatus Nanoarchaeia archaeon]